MAVIGDVLVKLQADFAEFSKGMDEANKKLDDFGKQAESTSAAVAKGTAIGTVIGEGIKLAIQAATQLAKETNEAALKAADLAQKYKLTTDQAQALQAMSQRTGVTTDALGKSFKGNTAELDKLAEALRNAGQLIDAEFVANAKKAADQADETAKRIQVLWAALAGPIGQGIQNVLASVLSSIGQSLTIIKANGPDSLSVIRSLLNLLSLGIAGAIAGPGAQIEDLDRRIRDLGDTWSETDRQIREIENRQASGETLWSGQIAHLESLRKQREELAAKIRADSAVASQLRNPPTMPEIKVTAPAIGGGGSRSVTEDPVEAAIKRYQALAAAAEKTADFVRGAGQLTVETLQRELEVRQKIDEILSRRGVNATPEQKERLEAAVRASQEAIGLQKQLERAQIEGASNVEKYGDGTAALAKVQKDLNLQLQIGRINQTVYDRATKATTESTEQAALAAKRYDDNIGSLGAGLEHAANAYARSNDLFSMGEQAFTGLTAAMGEGLDVLAGKSDKTFGQIAADFAMMLSRMALQAAVSQIFKTVFGAISPSSAPGFSPAAGVGPVGATPIALPRAGGGPVSAYQPYMVGEAGPELFIPKAAGNIVSNSQLGRGGETVVVNLDMKKAENAPDATAALDFGRKVKAAVVDVISNEKRPGGSLYRRVSA